MVVSARTESFNSEMKGQRSVENQPVRLNGGNPGAKLFPLVISLEEAAADAVELDIHPEVNIVPPSPLSYILYWAISNIDSLNRDQQLTRHSHLLMPRLFRRCSVRNHPRIPNAY